MKRHLTIFRICLPLAVMGLSLLFRSSEAGAAPGSPTDPLGRWFEASSLLRTEIRSGWIINERRQSSPAHLRIVATHWGNLTGELDAAGTTIYWANRSLWTRDAASWDVSGVWYYEGDRNRPCWIEPSRDGLRLTNERGRGSAGRLQIVADGWRGLTGTIVGPEIWWENGTVWTRGGRFR